MKTSHAFLLHLSGSAAVVGLVCLLIFFVWYPQPYFEIAGAWSVLQVLIGVDLVVGPVMTLILYRPGKKGLIMDLAIIAVIQLSALVYGVSVIYQERPYYLVFAVDRFEVLSRSEVDNTLVDNSALGNKPFGSPLMAVALFPDDAKERQQLLFDVIQGKPDLERRPEHWHNYLEKKSVVIERAMPLQEFLNTNPAAQTLVASAGSDPANRDVLRAIPVTGKKGAFTMLIDARSGKPSGMLNIDPWESAANP